MAGRDCRGLLVIGPVLAPLRSRNSLLQNRVFGLQIWNFPRRRPTMVGVPGATQPWWAAPGALATLAGIGFHSVIRMSCPQCTMQCEVSALNAQCSDNALECLCIQCTMLPNIAVFSFMVQCAVHCVWRG